MTHSFAVKPVGRSAGLRSCAYPQEAGGDPGAGLIRRGRNASVSSVMFSAQNRCRPRPLDLVRVSNDWAGNQLMLRATTMFCGAGFGERFHRLPPKTAQRKRDR